jgi:hypothetical protein
MSHSTIMKDLFPSYAGKRDAERGKDYDPPKPDLADKLIFGTKLVDDNAAKYTAAFKEESARQSERRERENNEYLRQIAENTKRD